MAPAVDLLAVERAKPFVVDFGQHALQTGLIVAGVVDERLFVRHELAGRIGQFVLADQIDAAEFGGIDAEIVGREVHQPFAKEIRLEAAGPAIGADRRLVGLKDRDVEFDGNAIRPDQELGGCAGTMPPLVRV